MILENFLNGLAFVQAHDTVIDKNGVESRTQH